MQFDWIHMLVTVVIIYVVLWGLGKTGKLNEASGAKRFWIRFIALFVVIFVLNLIWPYGSGLN